MSFATVLDAIILFHHWNTVNLHGEIRGKKNNLGLFQTKESNVGFDFWTRKLGFVLFCLRIDCKKSVFGEGVMRETD